MFNKATEYSLAIATDTGDKELVCLFPSDEAWIARHKTRYVQMMDVGKGDTVSKAMNAEQADLAVLKSVQMNTEVEFDGSEAVILVENLATADVISIEKVGGTYEVALRTASGETKHTLKVPSIKDIRYRNEASVKYYNGRNNISKMWTVLAPSGELYDKYFESCEEYEPAEASTVPLPHKYAVVNAISAELTEIRVGGNKQESFRSTPGQNTQQ